MSKISEEETVRKRALADKMAKKKAKQDAIVVHLAVFISILALAVFVRGIVGRLGYWVLVILGILIASASSWVIKERNYAKHYQTYFRELPPDPEKEGDKDEN